MKRLFLFLLYGLLSTSCYSQFFIGLSESEVTAEARRIFGGTIKINRLSYGSEYALNWYKESCDWIVIFNINKKSVALLLVPKDTNTLNASIELFNKQYVVISSRMWKVYERDKVYSIELVYNKKFHFSFVELDTSE